MLQQLQWSAACQWLMGWMGGGTGGEAGEGVCIHGSGGGEVAHGQGPRRTHWRLALEDFWTTTLLHQNPANPGSLLTLFQPKSLTSPSAFDALSLSLPVCLSYCLSHLPLPPWHIFLLKFSHSVDPNPHSFALWLPSHFSLTAVLLVASPSCCVFSTFSPLDFVFLHIIHHSFSSTVSVRPLHTLKMLEGSIY